MKIRPTKKAVLILMTAICIVVFIFLLMNNFKIMERKNTLETQLSTAQTQLQGIQIESLDSQQVQLKDELDRLVPKYESAKNKITDRVTSSNATAGLFEIAWHNGFSVIQVSSTSTTNVTLDGVPMSSMSINAQVQGALSMVVNFLTEVSMLFKNVSINSISINVPVDASENSTPLTTQGQNRNNLIIDVDMTIFTYRGD